MLAIFNLMPVPPLDGHWFLLTFWPKRFSYLKRVYAQYGFFLFIIFLIFIFPKVIPLLNILFKLIVGV
jgi:Zn-dependent protease